MPKCEFEQRRQRETRLVKDPTSQLLMGNTKRKRKRKYDLTARRHRKVI
jgi:hypothetical protein